MGDEIIAETATAFYAAVSLAEFGLSEINTYRITALLADGTIIGGRSDSATGLFVFEARVSGEFSISYLATLRRISL